MASNLPDDRLRHPGESELSFAALSGRLLVHIVPVALVVVMLEAGLALSIYPALGDILHESWLALGLRLWTVGVAFVLVLAVGTAGVAFALQRYIGWTAMFGAGVVVTISLAAAAIPFVLRVIFPTRIPWDRSLLAVVIAFAVAMPAASMLFGYWVRFAAARRVRTAMASAAGLSVLLAIPGCIYGNRDSAADRRGT